MRFISVCSGIEAASVAWHPIGFKAVAFSEIEAFPSAVLAHHYPTVPNWGDMTKFKEWPDANVDVLVGGPPCQSFSVAGLRKGLDDPRGNLMLTFGAIAERYRPKWLVWENVPGVLSSNGGGDFGAFLGMLGQLGYGFAYRVLDAQYFGVAQRRRRVFVVGNLRDWRRAAAVLFERHSLQGHPAPSRETRKVAPTIPSRSTGGGGLGTDFDCDGGLIPETVGALTDGAHNGGGSMGRTHIPDGYLPSVAMCLNAGAMGRQDSESETLIPTIGGDFNAELPITFGAQMSAPQTDVDLVQTLQAKNPMAVATAMQVRRLTPVECERLQGFPDNYTNIPWRKKPESPDGPRYKALGNSMAVPVMRWIGKRIAAVSSICEVAA